METAIFGVDLAQGADDHVDLARVADDHVVRLTDSEQRELQYLLDQVPLNPYEDFEEFVLLANLMFHELPKRLRRRLLEFQRSGNEQGAILVRGLPVDPVLPD